MMRSNIMRIISSSTRSRRSFPLINGIQFHTNPESTPIPHNGNNHYNPIHNHTSRSFSVQPKQTSSPTAPPAQQINNTNSSTSPSPSHFPSLIIGPNSHLLPLGSFAEAQAAFLEPPSDTVEQLLDSLLEHKIGIVAHYYMDVELQGVLHAVKRRQMELLKEGREGIPSYPMVTIADSLAMGDHAVQMCQHGAQSIICLGVDFMSESVSAIMGKNGYGHVPVYRATTKHIGCSLAESAEGDSYRAWLHKTAEKKKALHVVYINTSLETKAISSSIVPTITCTSSNVLQTILQASAQVGPEELHIGYGPDTYMGENLVALLDAILAHGPDSTESTSASTVEAWTDERIARDLHPGHTRSTLLSLRNNLHVYPHGNCIVHHMFGSQVVETVLNHYDDAFVTAHLEVPGEMFQIALQKSLKGEGVVGSTSNILNFISEKVEEAAKECHAEGSTETKRLKFILGTEAGMVTSIVRSVQDILDANPSANVEAEIIFPVSSEAVMGVDEKDPQKSAAQTTSLEVVPGVAGGEGCSTAGGCATCPFMKMNDLDAVHDIVDMIQASVQQTQQTNKGHHEFQLKKHLPPNRLQGKSIGGKDAIELGSEPIVFMRHFMKEKVLSDELVKRIMG